MRRFFALLLGGGLLLGCAGKVKVSPEELRNHRLTQEQVAKFIEVYPKVEAQLSGILADQDPKLLLTDPYALFAEVQLDRDMVKALRAEGYKNPKEFLLVLGSLLPAYYKVKAEEDLAQLKAQLAQLEADTSVSIEKVDSLSGLVKEGARALEQLRYDVPKENLDLVRAHLPELRKILE